MKYDAKLFGLALPALVLGLGMHAGVAHALEAKIGVVDMQLALQSSDEGKKAKADLEKEFNLKKKELQAEEAKIKKASDEFTKQAPVLAPEARAKKQGEIQESIALFQERTARAQTEIQQKERDKTLPIIGKVRSKTAEVAKKDSYTHVFDKSVVVYLKDEADDLTDKVVKAVNAAKSGG